MTTSYYLSLATARALHVQCPNLILGSRDKFRHLSVRYGNMDDRNTTCSSHNQPKYLRRRCSRFWFQVDSRLRAEKALHNSTICCFRVTEGSRETSWPSKCQTTRLSYVLEEALLRAAPSIPSKETKDVCIISFVGPAMYS